MLSIVFMNKRSILTAVLALGLAECKALLCAVAAGMLQGQNNLQAQLVLGPRGM